jgi:hypothetical protein
VGHGSELAVLASARSRVPRQPTRLCQQNAGARGQACIAATEEFKPCVTSY